MFDNEKEVMVTMSEALCRMNDAFTSYKNNDYETAYTYAVQSAMNAVFALNMFVNDYPYGEHAFDETRRIFSELEKLKGEYEEDTI